MKIDKIKQLSELIVEKDRSDIYSYEKASYNYDIILKVYVGAEQPQHCIDKQCCEKYDPTVCDHDPCPVLYIVTQFPL